MTKKLARCKCLLIAMLLLSSFCSLAQLNKANQYFESLQYTKAIPLYLKVLEKNEDSLATKNLAESYRRINDFVNAELFYKKAAEYYPLDRQIQHNYAQLLKSNHKIDRAKEVFIVYASKNPFDTLSQKYILSCDQIKSWTVEIPNFEAAIEDGINSEGSDFAAIPFENGVAFVTDRFVDQVEGFESATENPYLKIAYTEIQEDSTYKKVKPMKNFNNNFHNGPICFNASQTFAVFTRVDVAKNQEKNFINKPQLYVSTKEGKNWSKPEPFQHNNINYSFAHPSVSQDESMLFFASDMVGGMGGFDIYMSKKNSTGWSEPINLGDKINTFGNEIFPYAFSNDTIYFSSNTHVGYGGQDVFYSTFQKGAWTTSMNLKNQVNSPKDDFGIIFTDKKHGFFSSNRDGGKGKDDIYAFTLVREMKERTSVSGIFLYSELDPANGATISLMDEDGNVIMVTQTDANGKFIFEDLEAENNYLFMVNEEDPLLTLESKIYLTNEQGEKVVALNQPGPGLFKFRTLPPDVTASLKILKEEDVELSFIDVFGQLYDKLPGDYSKLIQVLLVDDAGEIIYSTVADSAGNFAFENILPLADYKLILKPDTSVKMLFKDAVGNKIGEAEKNNKGEYDYKKQQFMATSSVFGRVYNKLPGDFGKKMEVYLVDDNGEIVFTALTDENGDFIFENLPPDQQYIFKMKGEDSDYKLLLLDEAGEPKTLASQNANGDYVLQEKIIKLNNFFGKVYQKLPGDYGQKVLVYLLDDNGEIVYTTTTDEDGNFVFENLPLDKNYVLKLQDSEENLSMVILDEFGQIKSKANKTSDGNFNVENNNAANSLFGNIYQKLPGDYSQRMEVYLVDDEGNIVYTALTDENGDFIFENLPPDHKFKLRLKNDADASSMMVLNDFGKMEKVSSDGMGEFNVAELPKKDLIGNFYQTLPGDLGKIIDLNLVTTDGTVVYKTKTDKSGNFRFNNLPADTQFNIQLANIEDNVNMILLNDGGEMIGSATNIGKGVYEIKENKQAMQGRVFNKLPGDFGQKMEVYLVDDDGTIMYTAITDENGDFIFTNLPPDHNYRLKFNDDLVDANVIILDEFGNKIAQADHQGKGEYSFNKEEETGSIFGKAYQKLPGDFSEKMVVHLLNDEGEIVYTTTTDEKGNFEFNNLSPDINYVIRFESDDANMKLLVLDEKGKEVDDFEMNENGDFSYEYLSSKKEYISLLTLDDVVIKIKEDDKFTMLNLYFEYDSYKITANAQKELNKIALVLKKNPHVGIQIKGYTDNKGDEKYNLNLSEQRAVAVANHIVKLGVGKNKITTKGYGESMPVAPNELPNGDDNPDGRSKNRRSEINIIRIQK